MNLEYKLEFISEDYLFLMSKLYELNLINVSGVQIANDIAAKLGSENGLPKSPECKDLLLIVQAIPQILDKQKIKDFLDRIYEFYPWFRKETFALYIDLIKSLDKNLIWAYVLKYEPIYKEDEIFLRTKLTLLFEQGFEQNKGAIEAIIDKLKMMKNEV